MKLAALWTAAAASAAVALAALPPPTVMFAAYTTQPPCFRQPVLVATKAALLGLVEGRFNTYCSGTDDGPAPRPILVKRSTDGGVTWDATASTVYEGDVDFLTALYDASSGKTHLFIQQGSATIYTTSADDGVTWSAGKTLSFNKKGYKSVIPAVGAGLVIDGALCSEATCGGAAGRLLAPFICTAASSPLSALRGGLRSGPGDVKCPGCYSCVMVSDDGGATWALGGASNQDGSREASLVQLPSSAVPGAGAGAVVYMTERNMGNATNLGSRWHTISLDSGSTFDASLAAMDPTLPDVTTANWTGVVSGAARLQGTPAASTVLYTAPATPGARATMTAFISADETATWAPSPAVLWAGPAAYSSTIRLNDTHFGVLFEHGDAEFAERIGFLAVTPAELQAGV